MLWLLVLLLLSAWGILWWRFAMPAGSRATVAPPVLAGNHPSLQIRHYRLADFHPPPLAVPPATESTPGTAPAAEQEPSAAPHPEATVAPQKVPAEPPPSTSQAGQLPEGARHNYLADPAPTATDEHNRRVELTAAERRAKMRSVMSAALENHRAAPATT